MDSQRHRNRLAAHRGQALFELLMMIPLLGLIMMGTFHVGMALFMGSNASNAIKEISIHKMELAATHNPAGGYTGANPYQDSSSTPIDDPHLVIEEMTKNFDFGNFEPPSENVDFINYVNSGTQRNTLIVGVKEQTPFAFGTMQFNAVEIVNINYLRSNTAISTLGDLTNTELPYPSVTSGIMQAPDYYGFNTAVAPVPAIPIPACTVAPWGAMEYTNLINTPPAMPIGYDLPTSPYPTFPAGSNSILAPTFLWPPPSGHDPSYSPTLPPSLDWTLIDPAFAAVSMPACDETDFTPECSAELPLPTDLAGCNAKKKRLCRAQLITKYIVDLYSSTIGVPSCVVTVDFSDTSDVAWPVGGDITAPSY